MVLSTFFFAVYGSRFLERNSDVIYTTFKKTKYFEITLIVFGINNQGTYASLID